MLAYIDPGAGTIILQTLIAAALGVMIFFRDTVKRVFLIVFGRRKPEDDGSDDSETANEEQPEPSKEQAN